MKQIIVINKNNPASQYGIGTYVSQLKNVFDERTDCRLNVINLFSSSPLFAVHNYVDYDEFNIPPPTELTYDNETNYTIYSQTALYLLSRYFSKSTEIIFILNFTEHLNFIEFIRNTWVRSYLIYVNHFLDLNSQFHDHKKSFLKEMDKIICLSIDSFNYFKQQSLEKDIVVISNGLHDEININPEKNFLRAKYSINEKDKIFLFVGRVDLFKGLDYLLNAFKMIIKDEPDLHLFIVGDGLIEKYCGYCNPYWNKISFTGKIDKKQVNEFYQMADIGIIPSFHEQCSYVAIEMMMHGLPIIASDVRGLNEMFVKGENVIDLVPIEGKLKRIEEDSIRFYQAMKYSMENWSFMKKYGNKARKTYEEKYNFEIFKNKYLTLINQITFN